MGIIDIKNIGTYMNNERFWAKGPGSQQISKVPGNLILKN